MSFFSKNHKRILVVRPDRVGDVVLSTPVYHTLRQSFPGCFLGALVSPYTSPLLEGNPYIDVIMTDGSRTEVAGRKDFLRKVSEIRSYKFDTALLLMPTERLAYMLLLAGIPYRVGVGHILYEVVTFTRGVSRRKYNPLRHESDYMLDLARKLGATKIWSNPEIFLSDGEKDAARKFLKEKGLDTDRTIVATHPGNGHSAPNWEVEKYGRLAEMLSDRGVQVLVTGTSKEKVLEKAFVQSGDRSIRSSFGELSLRELTAVVSQVSLLVSSSTGPMHIASAVGTPTVSMFCPMTACSPKLWGPISSTSRAILPPEHFCREECPGDPHVCTFTSGSDGIDVKSVFDAAMELLNEMEAVYSKDTSNDNSTGHGRRR